MAIITPEIFANAVNAKMDTTLRIGRVAFDATDALGVDGIREAGSTIVFPKLNRVVTAVDVVKGTPLTPATIAMTDTKAVIHQLGASARVFDVEAAQIQGNVMNGMVLQVAESMAKRIDADLVTAMDTDAVYKVATGVVDQVTPDELEEAFSYFNDEIDTDSFAAIIVNSRVVPSFIGMKQFVENTLTYQTDNNGIVVNGVIGKYRGVPVIVCNNNTYDTAKSESKTYFVKKNVLAYFFQKNILVEEERESKLLATDIIASTLYATKLLDPKGVVILRKTIA